MSKDIPEATKLITHYNDSVRKSVKKIIRETVRECKMDCIRRKYKSECKRH